MIVNEGHNVILFCVMSAMENANFGLVWMRNGIEMTKLVRKELDKQWDSIFLLRMLLKWHMNHL